MRFTVRPAYGYARLRGCVCWSAPLKVNFRPPVESVYLNIIFHISQPKHIYVVGTLKTVSMRVVPVRNLELGY